MKSRDYLAIGRGILSQKAQEKAREFGSIILNNLYDYVSNEFPNPVKNSIVGNIQRDNWGTFGIPLLKYGIKTLNDTLQGNSAFPATSGSIVDYGPRNPISEPIISIPTTENIKNNIVTPSIDGGKLDIRRRRRRFPMRRYPIGNTMLNKKPPNNNEISINKLITPPIKTKKTRVYKNAL